MINLTKSTTPTVTYLSEAEFERLTGDRLTDMVALYRRALPRISNEGFCLLYRLDRALPHADIFGTVRTIIQEELTSQFAYLDDRRRNNDAAATRLHDVLHPLHDDANMQQEEGRLMAMIAGIQGRGAL